MVFYEYFHLFDGDTVEPFEPLMRGELLFDEFGIEGFKIGQNYQLFGSGVVTHIACFVRIACCPFFGGEPEKCHIEQIGFCGIDEAFGILGDSARDQIVFDGVGMDVIIHFGDRTFDIPAYVLFLYFVFFEALKLFDQEEFEGPGDDKCVFLH